MSSLRLALDEIAARSTGLTEIARLEARPSAEVCDDGQVMNGRPRAHADLWDFRDELRDLFRLPEQAPGTFVAGELRVSLPNRVERRGRPFPFTVPMTVAGAAPDAARD